ncbi:hypothetical protein F170042I7_21750 [Blautia caecimuris]|uniref:GmrSD restriction endonuclease domain-containing protein n=1 Tax=Blautia caecimuris TaxID=1796615 RepID=UPI0034B2AF02
MEFSSRATTVQAFSKKFEKDYSTKHKLQRQEGQWSTTQKSLLIDSLLRSIPIDPVRCELKENEDGTKVRYIFDGVQRSTTIVNFCKDGFKLKLPEYLNKIQIDNVCYEINGKKFSELDEAVQDKLNASEITIFNFTDCTEWDIKEMFRRQNNGKPLSNTQKRTAIESSEMSDSVFSLADHVCFEKLLSPAQLKKELQRDFIRETFMLICSNEEHDFTSFATKNIDNFVMWYSDHMDNSIHDVLENVLDGIYSMFVDQKRVKVNTTSIPMILYAGYRVMTEGKDFSAFQNELLTFIDTYDNNEQYKQYCGRGTAHKEMVCGRLAYWNNVVDAL